MTQHKYKKLESVIEKDYLAVLSVDFGRLNQLYEMITIIYHRNKNQHNMGLYFKHVKRIRLLLLTFLAEEQNSKISTIKLYGLIKYNPKFNKRTVKAMVYDFYNVINAKTFINLAIVMITVIAEMYDLLIVNYVSKIDSYLHEQKSLEVVKLKHKLRIMRTKARKHSPKIISTLNQDLITSENDTRTSASAGNDDLGEVIDPLTEETEPMPRTSPVDHNIQEKQLGTDDVEGSEIVYNKVKKKAKKKKSKKGKSIIDDIFGGF